VGSDGTVFLGAWNGALAAVCSCGSLKWSFACGGYVQACPAVASDGRLYIGAGDNKLYALQCGIAGLGGSWPKFRLNNRNTGSLAAATAVRGSDIPSESPGRLVLLSPFPNPFNPETVIRFSLPESGRVQAEVVDALGRHVRRLYSRVLPAGENEVRWDGRADSGESAESGVYLVRVRSGFRTETRKISLVR
jgi:hypothetical protein